MSSENSTANQLSDSDLLTEAQRIIGSVYKP